MLEQEFSNLIIKQFPGDLKKKKTISLGSTLNLWNQCFKRWGLGISSSHKLLVIFWYIQVWDLLYALRVNRSFDSYPLAKSIFKYCCYMCFFAEMTAPSSALQKVVGKASMYCRGWRCTWGPTMGRSPLCAPSLVVASSSRQLETWRTIYVSTQVCAPQHSHRQPAILFSACLPMLRQGFELGIEMKIQDCCYNSKNGISFSQMSHGTFWFIH